MRCNEVINQLRLIRDAYGDVEVMVRADSGYGPYDLVEDVVYHADDEIALIS